MTSYVATYAEEGVVVGVYYCSDASTAWTEVDVINNSFSDGKEKDCGLLIYVLEDSEEVK